MSDKKIEFAKNGKDEEAEEIKKIVIDIEGFIKSLKTVQDFQNEHKITLLNPKGLKKARVIIDRLSKDNKLRQFVTEEIGKQMTPIRNQIVANNVKMDTLLQMISDLSEQKRKRKTEPKELKEQTLEQTQSETTEERTTLSENIQQ